MPELPPSPADWPRGAREHYDERAGILEHLGGLSREAAEAQAQAEVRAWWRNRPEIPA